VLSSFAAYFEPYERGAGASGQAFVLLPEEVRSAVGEEVRRDLDDTGGPIEIEVEIDSQADTVTKQGGGPSPTRHYSVTFSTPVTW
jgi:hypothetical protein